MPTQRETHVRSVRLILAIVLVAALLPASGCSFVKEKIADLKLPDGPKLIYERIYVSGSTLGDHASRLVVVSDNHTSIPWLPSPENDRRLKDLESMVQSLDFSQFFLIIVYQGYRGVSGYTMQIRDIWQHQDTVYLKAHFNKPKGPLYLQIISSSYYVIKVSKEGMVQSGDLTFKLYDEFGDEKASTTGYIPAPTK